MSYYTIHLDGYDIYDPEYPEMTLLSPVCTTVLGESGSLEFTIPPGHLFYNEVIPYASTVEVFEDGESIFYGRALPPKTDIYGNKKVHCEGALAFLNDIILPPLSEYVDATNYVPEGDGELTSQIPPNAEGKVPRFFLLQDYIEYVFTRYNAIQTKMNRKLTLRGEVAETKELQYKSSYKTCLEILRDEIMPYTQNSMVVSRQNGTTYVDLVADSGGINQPIQSGANLLDLAAEQQGFYTAVVATGGKPTGASDRIKIDTPMILSQAAVNKYGMIVAYMDFPEHLALAGLQQRCRQFLNEQQFNEMEYDVKVIDLHLSSAAYDKLTIGSTVNFNSPMHGINNVSIVISKIVIKLDTCEKEVTLGKKKEVGTLSWMVSVNNQNNGNGDLDVDYAPTQGSTNPVTSGGVYEALQGAGGGGDGWTHQINGATQGTGTINFVTIEEDV